MLDSTRLERALAARPLQQVRSLALDARRAAADGERESVRRCTDERESEDEDKEEGEGGALQVGLVVAVRHFLDPSSS